MGPREPPLSLPGPCPSHRSSRSPRRPPRRHSQAATASTQAWPGVCEGGLGTLGLEWGSSYPTCLADEFWGAFTWGQQSPGGAASGRSPARSGREGRTGGRVSLPRVRPGVHIGLGTGLVRGAGGKGRRAGVGPGSRRACGRPGAGTGEASLCQGAWAAVGATASSTACPSAPTSSQRSPMPQGPSSTSGDTLLQTLPDPPSHPHAAPSGSITLSGPQHRLLPGLQPPLPPLPI